MPVITAPNKDMGPYIITEFIDSVNSSETVYTFPDAITREELDIENVSTGVLIVTVDTEEKTIQPFKSAKFKNVLFDRFTIKAEMGYAAFRATAIYIDSDEEDEKRISDDLKGVKVVSNLASESAAAALDKANLADGKADNLQSQLNSIVANAGNSNTEIVQMRTDETGQTFTTAKERVDSLGNKVGDVQKNTKPRIINLRGYDLTTNDASPIIKTLVDSGYTHILLPEKLRFDTPLNLTDKQKTPVLFEGTGRNQGEAGGYGTVISLNTGGIGVDHTGSQNIKWKDVWFTGKDCANPSTVGLFYGRSSTNLYAQLNKLDNVGMYLPSNPSANGGKGTVGIYNFKSELCDYSNLYIRADVPVVLTISNIYNIVSPYVQHAGELSMKSTSFSGITTLVATKGNAMVFDGASDVNIANLYMQRDMWSSSTEPYAIYVTSPADIDNQSNNINITNFDNELFDGFMKVEAKITNGFFKGQHTHGQGTIIYIPANSAGKSCLMNHCTININRGAAVTGTYQEYIKAEAGSYGFHSNTIFMSNSKYRVISNVLTYGNFFMSQAQADVQLVAGSKYFNPCDRGVIVNGKCMDWGGKPTTGTWNANDIRFNFDGSDGVPFLHVCVASGSPGTWKPMGQVGYRQPAGSPVGVLTPYFVGERVLDSTNKVWYTSVGTTVNDWKV